MEIFTTHFLFDSRYSKQLSHNFRAILRGIGDVVAGDEKLLHTSAWPLKRRQKKFLCAVIMASFSTLVTKPMVR